MKNLTPSPPNSVKVEILRAILELCPNVGFTTSSEVREYLSKNGIDMKAPAVRTNLVRYARQGLIGREKNSSGRNHHYYQNYRTIRTLRYYKNEYEPTDSIREERRKKLSEMRDIFLLSYANKIDKQEGIPINEILEQMNKNRQSARNSTQMGYRACVCPNCLTGYLQTIYTLVTPEGGTKWDYFPPHECAEEDINRAKSVNRDLAVKEAWKGLEKPLINLISKWGQKRKLLVSAPTKLDESNCIDLGEVIEDHWARRPKSQAQLLKATTLRDYELLDFLRNTHSTVATCKFTVKGERFMRRMCLEGEAVPSHQKSEGKEKKRRIIGYKGYICKKCWNPEALEVCYDGKEYNEEEHKCNLKDKLDLHTMYQTDRIPEQLNEDLTLILLIAVNGWARGKKYLQAFEYQPTEGYVEIVPINEDHWAMRAIKGRTTLNDRELFEFLEKMKGTAGVIKVRMMDDHKHYFYWVMLSDVPFEIFKPEKEV